MNNHINTIKEFLQGKGMDILLSLFWLLLTAIVTYTWHKLKANKYFTYRKPKKRIREAEIVTFYYDRKVLQSDAGTIGDYVRKARQSVVYVGFWLSSSLGSQDLAKAIRDAIAKGITMEFCLLAPDAEAVKFYEPYFEMPASEIVMRIQNSIDQLKKIKNDLPANLQRQLKIYVHNEIVTSSFWVVDRDDFQNCRVQVDHKIIANPRFSSYGFEIQRTSEKNEFATAFINGYLSVLTRSKEIS